MMRFLLCGALLACAAFPAIGAAQETNSGAVQIVGHVLKPEKLEPTQDLMDRLKLPEGFKL